VSGPSCQFAIYSVSAAITNQTFLAQLDEGIAQADASLRVTTASGGATIPVHLHWQISQAPGRDLTTLVQLGDPTQPPIAQADAPAVDG
jgi:hypothetical protein